MAFSVGQISASVGANTKPFMSGIQAVYQEGAKVADGIAKRFQRMGDQFTQTGKMLTTRVTAPLTALAGLSVKAFDTQIQAEKRLEAALRAAGEEVENNLTSFKAFASNLQALTTVGDESTLQLLQVAKSMGLTNEQAKRAAKNSIALAKAMGMNEQSAIRYAAALEQGESTMLARYLPGLRQIDDMSQRAAKAQELLADMFGAATAEAQNGLGPLTQIGNTLGDFSEEIGGIVLDRLQPLITLLGSTVDWFKALDTSTKELIVTVGSLAAAVGPLLLTLGGIIKLLPLLSAGFAALTGPVGLTVAAVGALAAAATYVYDNWDAFKERFMQLWGHIKNGVLEFAADIVDGLAAIFQYIPGLGSGLIGVAANIRAMKSEVAGATTEFKGFGESVGNVMSQVSGWLSGTKKKVKDVAVEVKKTAESVQAINPFAGAENPLKTATVHAQQLGTTINEQVNPSLENMRAKVDAGTEGMSLFQIATQKAKTGLNATQRAGAAFGQTIGDVFSQAVLHGKNLLSTIKNLIKQLAARAFVKGLAFLFSGGAAGGGSLLGSVFGGLFHSGGVVPGGGEKMVKVKGGEGIFTKGQMAAMGSLQASGGGSSMSEAALQRAFEGALDAHTNQLGPEDIFVLSRKGARGY